MLCGRGGAYHDVAHRQCVRWPCVVRIDGVSSGNAGLARTYTGLLAALNCLHLKSWVAIISYNSFKHNKRSANSRGYSLPNAGLGKSEDARGSEGQTPVRLDDVQNDVKMWPK